MNINDVTDDWLKRRRSIAIEFSTEGVAHEYLTRAFRKVTKQRQYEQINIH